MKYTLDSWIEFDFKAGPESSPWTRKVFRKGRGPAVIVIHEIPGIHPLVIRFAEHVIAAGHTVFMPSLVGTPGKPVSTPYGIASMFKACCVRSEFTAWKSGKSSPIVDWLKALARHAHQQCGGPGVGAVGMCFSGGFVLAMMTEPAVVAPVMSQPSLPLPIKEKNKAAIDASPEEIAAVKKRLEADNLTMLALRFDGDPFVPPERFAYLKSCFGDRLETIELDPASAQPAPGNQKPHSVLTIGLRDDDPSGPTKQTEQRVIRFFNQRLGVV